MVRCGSPRCLRCFDIRWSRSDSAGLFAGMREVAGQLADAAQAKSFFALDAGPLGKFITVHPLGGCPMSDDPARGVTDHRGRVHGYDGLYVLDGSIVPDRPGREPVQDDRRAGRARRRASAGRAGAVMAGFEVRHAWKNHLGNQRIDPLRIYAPGVDRRGERDRARGRGGRGDGASGRLGPFVVGRRARPAAFC